jgi:hypothetical protein
MKKFLKEDIDPDLMEGDVVVVNGVFEDESYESYSKDYIKTFKDALGVIIEQGLFENYHLIKFFNWDNGSDGWENPKCGPKDCYFLPKERTNTYFKGSIKLSHKKPTIDDISDIFSSLNENQEEDWWEHLIKDPNQKIRLDYYEDLVDKDRVLQPGDNIEIMANQDGLKIEGDAMIVDGGDEGGYYLIRLSKILRTEDDAHTHCGDKQKHREPCECELGTGKCWWVHPSHMDKLYFYPNRKGDYFLK